MSSKPITQKTVEAFLRENVQDYSFSQLLYEFICTDDKHAKRMEETLQALIRKHVVVDVDAAVVPIFSPKVTAALGLPSKETEKRYFHVLNGHAIIGQRTGWIE